MPIIGKLLKNTTKLSVRIHLPRRKGTDDQVKVLKKLLRFAQETQFGKHYHFNQLLESENLVQAYQKAIPIRDYEQFYQTWLHRCLDDEKNVVWPGRIKYFALSSGTTGSPSKRIPVTKKMIRSFQRSTIKQFTATAKLDLTEGFYQRSFLAVGGSSNPEKVGKHFEADLSGILKKHTTVVLLPLTKPDPEISSIKDWNEKLERMIDKAPEWDISTIAGSPTWCIMLMERIVERYGVKTIHDVWPNLELFVYGGVYIDPYLKRLEQVCGNKLHLLNTYLASEGYFAYQNREDTDGMKLLLKSGIFFEFVPFNRDNFDESGRILPHAKALTINEVHIGEDYAMVITTNAGLWRYLLGDLVQFTDIERKEIRISGRIKQYLSLVGEHLSLDNINTALVRASEKLGVVITEFCLYTKAEELRHYWSLGMDENVDPQEVIHQIDKELCTLNDDYAAVRKYGTLLDPVAERVPIEKFYLFMEEKGKLGSQNKFPRVMNAHQTQEWRLFLGL